MARAEQDVRTCLVCPGMTVVIPHEGPGIHHDPHLGSGVSLEVVSLRLVGWRGGDLDDRDRRA